MWGNCEGEEWEADFFWKSFSHYKLQQTNDWNCSGGYNEHRATHIILNCCWQIVGFYHLTTKVPGAINLKQMKGSANAILMPLVSERFWQVEFPHWLLLCCADSNGETPRELCLLQPCKLTPFVAARSLSSLAATSVMSHYLIIQQGFIRNLFMGWGQVCFAGSSGENYECRGDPNI